MQGGYSDDLTVASKCAEHKLQILCPSYAVLPQWWVLMSSDAICLQPSSTAVHKHAMAYLISIKQ